MATKDINALYRFFYDAVSKELKERSFAELKDSFGTGGGISIVKVFKHYAVRELAGEKFKYSIRGDILKNAGLYSRTFENARRRAFTDFCLRYDNKKIIKPKLDQNGRIEKRSARARQIINRSASRPHGGRN
jgi:hypothetical protein